MNRRCFLFKVIPKRTQISMTEETLRYMYLIEHFHRLGKGERGKLKVGDRVEANLHVVPSSVEHIMQLSVMVLISA